MTTLETVKFDPGWGKHVLVYSGSVEYLYKDIARYKNMGQKGFKFKTYFPKIMQLLKNNVGFYTGCLLWAVYLKTLPNSEITGNHCLNETYEGTAFDMEADYINLSIDKLSRDYKYYTGKSVEISAQYKAIMTKYCEFALLNKGFSATKTTNDLLLPEGLKTPSESNIKEIIEAINMAVETGNLETLIEFADKIM